MAKRTISRLRKQSGQRRCEGARPWNRRIQASEELKVERQEQRERDRKRYGHSEGFLHEVPSQAAVDAWADREVAAHLRRRDDEAEAEYFRVWEYFKRGLLSGEAMEARSQAAWDKMSEQRQRAITIAREEEV